MSLVAVMLVAGATTTSAQTMSLCQTVDALVLAGVIAPDKVVAAKAAAGCTAAAPATAAFTRNLTVGSTGADVTALQTKLGVTPATGYFGAITKAKVIEYQLANQLPGTGYVGLLTLAKLNAGAVVVAPVTPVTPVTPVVTLNGGAGDLAIDDTNTGVKNTLKEGEENVKVLGLTTEADGSDINVTSIKVTLENASTTDGSSEKLSNYLDAVTVYMGTKKVGSADVSDFSKTSDTPDTFSKTISLSGATITDGEEVKLYVAVSAVSDIDTDDIAAHLNLTVNTVRFTDGTGAILSGDLTKVAAQDFSFDSSSVDTGFTMKTSSANPDNATVTVEDTEDSLTEELALVFKLDVNDDSEDISITSIPVTLTLAAGGDSADSIEDVVDSVTVNIAGSDFTADLTTDSVENGSGTAVYTVDIDTGDVELSGGDVKDVKVSLNLKGIDGNYAENTTIVASVATDSIDAETADDELTADQKDGTTKTGGTLTLSTSAVALSAISWTKAEGTLAASIDLFFTLEAGQNDIVGFAKSDVVETKTNIATDGVLTMISGDAIETLTGVFTIGSGDSVNFRVRYTVSTTGGEVKLSTIKGQIVPDAKKLSPTAYYQ